MRNVVLFLMVLLVTCIGVYFYLGSDPVPTIQVPESVVIYSLNGKVDPDDVPDDAQKFHGFEVLGETKIADAATRQKIVQALKKGISESDGRMAKCFWPRHGLTMVENGKTVEAVMCFECLQVAIHKNGSKITKATTSTQEHVFDKVLSDAGVELAPK